MVGPSRVVTGTTVTGNTFMVTDVKRGFDSSTDMYPTGFPQTQEVSLSQGSGEGSKDGVNL